MQYQFTERLEYIRTIEFSNSQALHIEKIRYFQEEGVSGLLTSQEFSYSWDNITWSNWNTLTQANLSSISFRDRPDFWLKLKYYRNGIEDGNILRWYLIYDELSSTPSVPPVDTSIDAWTFRGEGPAYFLARENHIGAYTDINIQNLQDASSIGVYSERVDNSLGTTFFFKSVKSKEGILLDVSNGIIEFSLDSSIISASLYLSLLDPSVTMATSVGGIPAGTTVRDLNGSSMSSLWDALLFPTINPTYVAPSGTFIMSPNTTLYEVNSSIGSLTFTSTFDTGLILLSGVYQNSRSGLPNTYNYTGLGLDSSVISTSLVNSQIINGYMINEGIQSWTSSVSYDIGPQPLDSKGNSYESPLPAGSLSAGSRSIEGVYPIFATSSNISLLSQQALVSMITGNNIEVLLVAQPSGSADKQRIDIPLSWLVTRPLKGIQQYNTFSYQWEYPGGSATSSLLLWDTSSTSHVIQGISVNYTRYTYNGVARSNVRLKLIF